MAELLKNHFGKNIPRQIAAMIAGVYPRFPAKDFIKTALTGYEPLNFKKSAMQPALIDLRIHFVKANSKSSPKVFKLKQLELEPKQTVRLQKRISLKEMTTRKHYPGKHKVDVMVNGQVVPVGEFQVVAAKSKRKA